MTTATEPLAQGLPPQRTTSAKQGSCLSCGRPRSSRARYALQDSALHNLVCSRRLCAQVKSLLRNAAAGALVVEIHHHYHTQHSAGHTHPAGHMHPAHISELHGQACQNILAELPGGPIACHNSQDPNRLPTIFEEPPYVDVSSKPSTKEVMEVLSVLTQHDSRDFM